MRGVEIVMVVSDSLKALEEYEKIFEVQRLEVTNFTAGKNEAVFSVYGTRFHLLDENPACGLMAPSPEYPQSVWHTIVTPDIKQAFRKALKAGCTEIQPVKKISAMGISNAIIADSSGYIWMLHEVQRKMNFMERCRIFSPPSSD